MVERQSMALFSAVHVLTRHSRETSRSYAASFTYESIFKVSEMKFKLARLHQKLIEQKGKLYKSNGGYDAAGRAYINVTALVPYS